MVLEAFELGLAWGRWFAVGGDLRQRSTPDARPAFGGGCRARTDRPGSMRRTNAARDCCGSASFRAIAGCWQCLVRAFLGC